MTTQAERNPSRALEADGAERPSNIDDAASPQAIAAPVPPKPPLADNDPTKTIPTRAWLARTVVLALALGALLVLAVATAALR